MKHFLKNIQRGWNKTSCDAEAFVRLLAPPSMTVSRTDVIERIKNKKDIVREIGKSLKKKKYNGGRQAQHMLAAGVAMTPNISINSAKTMISCAHRSFFVQYGIDAT